MFRFLAGPEKVLKKGGMFMTGGVLGWVWAYVVWGYIQYTYCTRHCPEAEISLDDQDC